jgi:hypothetical protein
MIPRRISGRLPAFGTGSGRVYKWMGITFGVGMLLLVTEIHFAKKKKEGFTATDRQRVVGIFWLSLFLSGLVGFLVWATD